MSLSDTSLSIPFFTTCASKTSKDKSTGLSSDVRHRSVIIVYLFSDIHELCVFSGGSVFLHLRGHSRISCEQVQIFCNGRLTINRIVTIVFLHPCDLSLDLEFLRR